MKAVRPRGVRPKATPLSLHRLCDDPTHGDCAVLLWTDGMLAHTELIEEDDA